MYKKTTLKNGLRIITVPMKETNAVTVFVTVGVGWKYETKDVNGISHFLEHMFFKGTRKRPDKKEIVEPLDRIGGMHNASTSDEATSFYAKVDRRHLNIALDIIADLLINSRFDSRAINQERGVIIEEINMYQDVPMQYIENLWLEVLYGNQPAGWPILGTKKTVSKLSRSQFLKYFKDHYVTSNTIICIAGRFNEKKVIKDIKRYFEKIRVGRFKAKKKVIEKQKNPNSLIHFKKTDQTHVFLGVRGYDLFNPQRFTQAILARILGGFMSSRLFLSIREKRGLAYYIKTIAESTTDTGYLATWAGVDNKRVDEVIGLILKEYKSLRDKRISKSELQKGKDNLKGALTLSLETSSAQASFHASQELLTGKILTLDQYLAKIDAVTVGDIQEVARDIFRPEKLNLALIGPFKDKKRFDKLLKI